jgi:hypothetical protein
MSLAVIGPGFGRTGTMSLKLALERLGFGPCHHMEEGRCRTGRRSPPAGRSRGVRRDHPFAAGGWSQARKPRVLDLARAAPRWLCPPAWRHRRGRRPWSARRAP